MGSETNTSLDSKIELSNSLFDKVMEEAVVKRDNPCGLEEMIKVIAEIPEVGSETNTSIDSKIELSNALFDKVMEEPAVGTKNSIPCEFDNLLGALANLNDETTEMCDEFYLPYTTTTSGYYIEMVEEDKKNMCDIISKCLTF